MYNVYQQSIYWPLYVQRTSTKFIRTHLCTTHINKGHTDPLYIQRTSTKFISTRLCTTYINKVHTDPLYVQNTSMINKIGGYVSHQLLNIKLRTRTVTETIMSSHVINADGITHWLLARWHQDFVWFWSFSSRLTFGTYNKCNAVPETLTWFQSCCTCHLEQLTSRC